MRRLPTEDEQWAEILVGGDIHSNVFLDKIADIEAEDELEFDDEEVLRDRLDFYKRCDKTYSVPIQKQDGGGEKAKGAGR